MCFLLKMLIHVGIKSLTFDAKINVNSVFLEKILGDLLCM